MNISIWGSEICGWVAAAALAEVGNTVSIAASDTSVSINAIPNNALGSEPGLEATLALQLDSDRLSLQYPDACELSDIHIFAFAPSEYDKALAITQRLADAKDRAFLIINHGNFGIGRTAELQKTLDASKNQIIAYIPDNLPQGDALAYYRRPSSVIIGSENRWAIEIIETLLRPFTMHRRMLQMSSTEAEFSKFAITGMLALRLGYINELANLADNLEVDIEVIRQGMAADPRIGAEYLSPGCGFGGQYFSRYIEGMAETLVTARNSSLLDTVLRTNEKQKEVPFRKLWRHYGCDLAGKTVSIWGLAFKPKTSSIVNAPSLPVIDALLAQRVSEIRVHDPEALENISQIYGNRITLCSDSYEALRGSDGLLLLTEWDEYWSPDYTKMLKLMNHPLIVDGRNIYNRSFVESLGFAYAGSADRSEPGSQYREAPHLSPR